MKRPLTRVTEKFEVQNKSGLEELLQRVREGNSSFIDEVPSYIVDQVVHLEESPDGKIHLCVADSAWSPMAIAILLRALIQNEPQGTEWFTTYSQRRISGPYVIHTGGVLSATCGHHYAESAEELYRRNEALSEKLTAIKIRNNASGGGLV